MLSAKQSFLSQFDSGVLPHVFEFGKRISQIQADVFLLMARKAACFVDCLETAKLTALSGIVTTDRVLDMDTSWLRGKHVVIIDDALISGTTLYQTARKLRRAGAGKVALQVFCVNKDWWSPDLVVPDEPYLELDDKHTTSFCVNIVNAMSVYPRPYSIDYPLLNGLRVPEKSIEVLSSLANWNTYDVTTSIQGDHGIFSLTAIPKTSALDDLNRRVGWCVSDHSQLIKVRVYGRLLGTDRKTFWCRVMPMVAFDPMQQRQVNDLWTAVIAHNRLQPEQLRRLFSSVSSRLRFLQYVTAGRIGELWVEAVAGSLSTRVVVQHDLRNSGYAFPPQVVDVVRKLCSGPRPLVRLGSVSIRTVDVPAMQPQKTKRFKGKDLWSIQARLTEPFLDFYREKEIRARELAKTLGRRAFNTPQYTEILNRLRTGISLPQLRALLSDVRNTVDVSTVVSLFIDLAIDRGIVVPVTANMNGTVFRAYRHGEDVEFSESEARLCCLVLDRLAKAAQRQTLPHLWAEKALVLLIRIGLHRGLLNRWAGALGAQQTVGIRYALKGAVVKADSSKLYEYNPEGSLTSLFLESGYLKADNVSGLYSVATIPPAPTEERAENEAIIIGSLIGTVLSKKKNGKLLLTDDELILLATCLAPSDTAGALAASISIFSTAWPWTSKSHHASSLTKQECINLLASLGERGLYEAISSAVWKFNAFMSRVPWQIVDRIGDSLDDQIHTANWHGFWPSTARQGSKAFPKDLRSLLRREGVWCIRASIAIRMLEISLRLAAEDESRKPIKELTRLSAELTRYEKTTRAQNLAHKVAMVLSKNNSRTLDAKGLHEYALRLLDRLAGETRPILDLVDLIAVPFGQPRPVTRYNHALYVSNSIINGKLGPAVRGIISKYRNLSRKDRSGTSYLDLPVGLEMESSSTWISASGSMARAWLVRLACELCRELGTALDLRMILLAHLPDDYQLFRADNTSDYRGQQFWKLSQSLVETEIPSRAGTHLFFAVPSSKAVANAVEAEILGQKGNNLSAVGKGSKLRFNSAIPLTLTIREFKLNTSSRRPVRLQKIPRVEIGIITVVTEETKAVRNYLQNSLDYNENKSSSRITYEGSIPGAEGHHHKAICIQQSDQGNRSIISAYNWLKNEYSPKLIVLLGIAGSIHKDVKLGDVVVADQIIYYDKRKETRAGTEHRGESYKIPSWLKRFVNHFFVEFGEPAQLGGTQLLPTPAFKVFPGPIGSGEAVIGFREAEQRNWLNEYNSKTLVLETEAGGLAQAFYEESIGFDGGPDGYLIFRGVSDHADEEKDDKWRQIASDNAMTTLNHFLKLVPKFATNR